MHILIHMIIYKLVTSCIYISVGCLMTPTLVWLISPWLTGWFKKYVSCEDSLESNILFSKLFQNLQIRSCTEAIAETVGSIMNQHLGSNRYCFLDLRCDLVITKLLKNTTLWLWIYWEIQASHSSPLQQGVGVGIQSRTTGDTYCTCEVVMFI